MAIEDYQYWALVEEVATLRRQVSNLRDRINTLERNRIDPFDFERLQNQVAGLEYREDP